MRVVIFVAGTMGDVRPNVALGQGIGARGHDVTIVTSGNFEALVREAGLDFAPLTADFQTMMRRDRARFDGKPQFLVALHGLRCLSEMATHWAAEGLPPARGAGLIIGSGVALYLAASIAEALDVPFVRTMLQPIEPAREIMPMLLGTIRMSLPGRTNLALHAATRNLTWHLARPAMTRVRRDLGLAPYPARGPWRSPRAGRARLLNGFSASMVPHSRDWGDHVATTGYWWLRPSIEYTPDARLAAFLRSGPRPVYIGFGSMVTKDAARLAAIVREAVLRSGTRAILAGGWNELEVAPDPDLLAVGDVPHDWLLPQTSLAVHHCGAGTAAAAAAAGIPSVGVPFLLDQFFWADRLHRSGIATAPLRRDRMTGASLAAAIGEASGSAMQTRAAAFGAELRREDGVGRAVAALDGWGLV